jgi:hypothetical protein
MLTVKVAAERAAARRFAWAEIETRRSDAGRARLSADGDIPPLHWAQASYHPQR